MVSICIKFINVLILCISFTKCCYAEQTQQTKWTNRTVLEFQNIEYGVYFNDRRKFLPPVERKSLKNTIHDNQGPINLLRSLHLSIYTTQIDSKYPVMVHIDLKSSEFEKTSPKFLLEKDIVLVNVDKYRTGPAGFLSMLNSHIPGNAGIFDIILALKWIKNNIWKYGGDANRVTLFGQYKAAGLIHVLMLSDLGVNLFNQVILESGSALLNNFTTSDPLRYSREVGIALECPDVLDEALLTKCLTEATNDDLIRAYSRVWIRHRGNLPFVTIGSPSNILRYDPAEIQRKGEFRVYPKIIGFVDQPSAYFLKHFDKNQNKGPFFSVDRFKIDAVGIIEYATKMFGKSPFKNYSRNISSLTAIPESDTGALEHAFYLVMTSILDWCNFHFKSAIYYTGFMKKTPKTFAYTFKYTGDHHLLPNNKNLNVAIIKDEDLYLFDQGYELNIADSRIAKMMVDYWTSFAETGVPQSKRGPQWPEVKPGSDDYLIIDDVSRVGHEYLIELQNTIQTYLGASDEFIYKNYSD